MSKQRDYIASKVVENLPANIKPINYLMDKLEIGRESAYRRMRGEIPFTFEEISLLSIDLGFSIDEITGHKKSNRAIFDVPNYNQSTNPEESFSRMLQNYIKPFEKAELMTSAQMFTTTNNLLLCMITPHSYLTKFYYYRWLQLKQHISGDCALTDTQLSPEVLILLNKCKNYMKSFSKITCIVDCTLFKSVCRNIQYYFNRGLISEAEVDLLKQDLYSLCSHFKYIMQNGQDENGVKRQMYFSILSITNNSSFFELDENVESRFWIYAMNFIDLINQDLCYLHRDWIESQKRYSMLISQSNELLQSNFLKKQTDYIESIGNHLQFI